MNINKANPNIRNPIPTNLAELKDAPVLHSGVIAKEDMEKKKFNPNAVSESTVKNFRNEDEAAGLFIDQFFQDDDQEFLSSNGKMDEDSQEDVFADVRLDYYNFNPTNQGIDPSTLPSIDETYRVARFRAQQEYEKQYLVELKPMIYKKYGIQLK